MPSWSRDGRSVYFASTRNGPSTVWRVPANGGAEEPVPYAEGQPAYESADGKTLFFLGNGAEPPLLAVPVAGGSERKVIDCVASPWSITVGATGVYHLGCGATQGAVPLYLLDRATGRDRPLGTLEKPKVGFAFSPDGNTILYSKLASEGGDLMMIENFR
jgi:Tol biopolymer transport system component